LEPLVQRDSALYFENLDALRFLAFSLVFLRHAFGGLAGGIDTGSWAGNLLRDGLFNSGDVGVAFFFVLSGFLITYLILAEIETRGCLDVRAFYIRRSLRIWPLYYSVVAFGLLLHSREHGVASPTLEPLWPAYYAAFLSNLAALRYETIPLYLAITWSIAIEEQFYLVWPQLFSRIRRNHFVWIFGFVIIASLGFRAVHRNEPMVLSVHTLSVMSDFAVGGLVAYGAISCRKVQIWAASLGRGWIVAVYVAVIALLLLRNTTYAPTSSALLQRLQSFLTIVRRLILSLGFAFVIVEQNWGVNSPCKLSRLAVLSRLGKYTYGLYLLHPLALFTASCWLGLPTEGSVAFRSGLVRGFLGMALTLLLGILSYHLLERPFLRLKRRFAVVPTGALA
jgi:peptidoglycan/LPS O-acetylase OafA/YrhL